MACRVLRVGIDSRGADGFARALVGSLSEGLRAQAALLYWLDGSGKLVLRDSYGFSGDITQAFSFPDVFDDLPMGHAIRSSTTMVMTRQEVLAAVPRVSKEDLLFDRYAHIPCRSLDTPVGGIALAFAGPGPHSELPDSLLLALASVGAARLHHLDFNRREAA